MNKRIAFAFLMCYCQFMQAQLSAPKASILSSDKGNAALSLSQQKVESGEVPNGIDALSWASIQKQMEMGKYKTYPNPKGGYLSANPRQGFHISYDPNGKMSLTPFSGGDYHVNMRLKGIGYQDLEQLRTPMAVNATSLGAESGSKVTYQWNENLSEWWINDPTHLEQWFYIKQAPVGKTAGQKLRLRLDIDTDMKIAQKGNILQLQKGSNILTYDKLKVWDATGQELATAMVWQEEQLDIVVDDAHATYPLTIDPQITQQAYIKASNTNAEDRFGESVAISGETIVVGAKKEASNATGTNGNQADNSASNAGAVYVFVRSGTTWTQQAYLKASNTGSSDYFGYSVAIDGETIVVGASGEASNAKVINGNQADNSASAAGAVYVFVRSGTTWTQQAYIKASNTDASDSFGSSVAISGETVVVGAPGEASKVKVINGNQTDNSLGQAGAAYVFVRSGTTWTQQAYLKASNTNSNYRLGISVAISGETIVVGSDGEQSLSTGVNGSQTNSFAAYAGAAYVFVRSGTTWAQQAYLKASNTEEYDYFGQSVSISGETIVVGAAEEDSNAMGVNSGDQTDNSVNGAGAAYVFVRSGTTWTQQAYLKASNTNFNSFFGFSVAISGETIVVGSNGENSNATGVNGNQLDVSAFTSGAAYVFTRSGTTWSQLAYLKASNTGSGDQFGQSVAISGSTIVVGASIERSNATGINGNQADNSVSGAGAVYVFTLPLLSDLSVSASPLTNTVNAGEYQTYVVTLNNAGPAANTGVKVRVQIPANRSFISAVPSSGSYDPQSEIWTVGDVPIGNKTLTMTLKMN
jgi:uncharacterized repeat protein (TIGR01451 family)